tara:strand:- start:3793 stop:4389 length:597 start_codon:yes stop_codon:yes gene_type:complete
MNPHRVTADFEQALCEYTGAPHAIALDSCSNAIFLSLKYLDVKDQEITIPSHTYMSVPCQIIHAGAKVKFQPSQKFLKGAYRLTPTPVWDSALRFTKGMYREDQYMCLSFSGPSKILKLGKGGAILTDNEKAANWFRKARYHGRNAVPHISDHFHMLGWNMYMPPETAARGLVLMAGMKDNLDVSQEYQDLSKFEVYK